MKKDENLYSKSGIILQKIAEELLFINIDERIPKIGDFSSQFNVGRGTIQTALKKLEDLNCISLESRGHLGTFLRSKNINNLLDYSGISQITAVMPLPYSKKYEGLATGLTYEFEQLNLSFNIAFMRGDKLRLNGLKEGRYDFALVSRFSAKEELKNNSELSVVLGFGVQTYVSNHAIIFSDPSRSTIIDGMKIGIDDCSTDQVTLTNAETDGKKVEYVQLNYMHLLPHLKANNIDATIWSIDQIDKEQFHTQPLTSKQAIQYEKEMNEAVCLIEKGNRKLEYILNLLSKEKIVEIQSLVEGGSFIPRY
ncbi:GntR family transcriptional regulator YhfZ [Peribacillus muralis]|uniref:GntR family transcriptional regulator YhfZ n=1 Tax=Peribacillus muralis TaxID=264697 RepID=UPI003671A246